MSLWFGIVHISVIFNYVLKLIEELIIFVGLPAGAPCDAGIQQESEEQRNQSENINCPSEKPETSDQPPYSDALMNGEEESKYYQNIL